MPISATRPALIDRFGRRITYLRLSITDRCDFRCNYCMAETMQFLPRHRILSLEECLRVARIFVDLGVSKIRITGGEPLVRKNALWLLERLSTLPGLKELVLTTNGSQLERYALPLRQAGVRRINISLDSLDPARFRAMTRVGDLARVLGGIEAALRAGFDAIKLNTVMMRGVNDSELESLTQFAVDRGIDIAFIEEMPLGTVDHRRGDTYFSSDAALARLRHRFDLVPSTKNTGGPARYWRVAHSPTQVGFISPHSHNFCADCNRVRVTCQGELFPCLGQDERVDLMAPLRRHPNDDVPLRQAIAAAMGIKPEGHDFDLAQPRPKIVRFMSMTGG